MSAFKSACRPALFIFCVVQLASCGDGGGTTSAVTPKISVDQTIVAKEVECMKQYAAVSTNNYVNYAAAIGASKKKVITNYYKNYFRRYVVLSLTITPLNITHRFAQTLPPKAI